MRSATGEHRSHQEKKSKASKYKEVLFLQVSQSNETAKTCMRKEVRIVRWAIIFSLKHAGVPRPAKGMIAGHSSVFPRGPVCIEGWGLQTNSTRLGNCGFLVLMCNRFCQLLDPRRTLCFQSSWLDFKDFWIIIYNMHRSPEMEKNIRLEIG